MKDAFSAPDEESDEGESEGYSDVKKTQGKVLQSVLGLDESQSKRLVEAICALAKEEPYDDADDEKKGSALLIAMGKPRK